MRQHELPDKKLSSIYLGGGTPSLLDERQLAQLLDSVYTVFTPLPDAEITLEANPDDVTPAKLEQIRKTPVNRFSLGVQSFFDEDLQWMNRAHNAAESERSIRLIMDAGFSRTSIDLIYGGPTLSDRHWTRNLEKADQLQLNHISAYSLTVEPDTALHRQVSKGMLRPPDEDKAAAQFDMLVDYLESSGFEQYEISNFARNGEYARHNTAYWQNKPYIGLGPSAHSFNGHERSWNVSGNQAYLRSIDQGILPSQKELLTPENRINEYIMTGLRTMWGCDEDYIITRFGSRNMKLLESKLSPYLASGQVEKTRNGFRLARHARILADGIASGLFF